MSIIKRILSALAASYLLLFSSSCRTIPTGRGALEVRTETFTYGGPENSHEVYKPYEVLDQSGKLIQSVENHGPTMEEGWPTRVYLPPGSYVIRASTTHGEVKVPVVVEMGKLTSIRAE